MGASVPYGVIVAAWVCASTLFAGAVLVAGLPRRLHRMTVRGDLLDGQRDLLNATRFGQCEAAAHVDRKAAAQIRQAKVDSPSPP